jgi:hydrogenase-4 membrane subunit HyfE
MPYFFPHEHLFVVGISVLILGLLVIRVRLARRRREQAVTSPEQRADEPPDHATL